MKSAFRKFAEDVYGITEDMGRTLTSDRPPLDPVSMMRTHESQRADAALRTLLGIDDVASIDDPEAAAKRAGLSGLHVMTRDRRDTYPRRELRDETRLLWWGQWDRRGFVLVWSEGFAH